MKNLTLLVLAGIAPLFEMPDCCRIALPSGTLFSLDSNFSPVAPVAFDPYEKQLFLAQY
jgi:hypothetical protein